MIINCCDNQALIKNGIRNGYQNYKCKACGKQMNDSSNPPYRPCKSDRSLTNAERQKLWREKKKKLDNIITKVYDKES